MPSRLKIWFDDCGDGVASFGLVSDFIEKARKMTQNYVTVLFSCQEGGVD